MLQFTLRRLALAVPLLLCVTVINFCLIHLAPGDPVSVMVGEFPPSEEELDALRTKMGLQQPLYLQLLIYVRSVVSGDLGYSYVSQSPVSNLILERIPATVELVMTALLVFTVTGVTLGVLSALRPLSLLDVVISGLSILGNSIPVFWLGQLLLLVFALKFQWLPAQGMHDLRLSTSGPDYVWDHLKHLLLPVIVLGTRYLVINARLARAGMLDALSQDYIRTAKAKGLRGTTVVFHAFRNAALPLLTILGVNLGDILAGSVLTEIVFGWPGIGRLMYDATFSRDYPLLMGLFLTVSSGVIVANFAVDLLYGLADPRTS